MLWSQQSYGPTGNMTSEYTKKDVGKTASHVLCLRQLLRSGMTSCIVLVITENISCKYIYISYKTVIGPTLNASCLLSSLSAGVMYR